MKIHKRDQKSQRKVRELLVNLVNLLDLVGHILDRLVLGPTLWCYRLLDVGEGKRLDLPPGLYSCNKLELALEYEPDGKARPLSRTDPQFEVKFFESAEVTRYLFFMVLMQDSFSLFNVLICVCAQVGPELFDKT